MKKISFRFAPALCCVFGFLCEYRAEGEIEQADQFFMETMKSKE